VSIYREKTAQPAAATQETVNASGQVTPVSSTR
jgi:hypothetical protein